ncbi:hypothetical protein SEA_PHROSTEDPHLAKE_22 [Gordonia phage PhrostedPhlake]|nr:hypothetical protein SEA_PHROSTEDPHLAKE_22 [Gordonia phage PhrostedPhlake]
MVGVYDAGNGFSYSLAERDGVVTNVMEWHQCGGRVETDLPSSIALDVPENDHVPASHRWQFTNLEDPAHLTLTPSILCNRCQRHGFLTNGVWKDC